MEKCEINNKTELNLYCNLLSVAYELYKDKTNGMVCGSEAENIRDKMYKVIKEAGIIDTKWRFYLKNGGNIMDMRSYIMECLERHLSDYDLDGVELTEEDVDAVERQIIKNNLTLNNAIGTVLLGISNSLM